jgi:hypothetical protein
MSNARRNHLFDTFWQVATQSCGVMPRSYLLGKCIFDDRYLLGDIDHPNLEVTPRRTYRVNLLVEAEVKRL